mmetsp:Transcript_55853/g.103382  ORF Transcript_55853/g.103382 Transcript_55853/m.103382 type:complete len:343 (-) Transcript_55853:103-1131(-)
MAVVSPELDRLPFGLMSVSATLEGAQPILIKHAVGKDVDRRTVVLLNEALKLGVSLIMAPAGAGSSVIRDWRAVVLRAGPPAALAILQNNLMQVAYPRLDPLQASVFGQTKIFFVALAARVVLGRRVTPQQAAALVMLVAGSWLMVIGPAPAPASTVSKDGKSDGDAQAQSSSSSSPSNKLSPSSRLLAARSAVHPQWKLGMLAQFGANVVSGLNFAVLELGLQGRSPIAFNVEMSLCGILSSLLSMGFGRSKSGLQDLFSGWTTSTAAVPVSMATSGIIAGFVVKKGGGIAKALASVGAIILVALVRVIVERRPLSSQQLMAVPTVIAGMMIYNRYPAAKQ